MARLRPAGLRRRRGGAADGAADRRAVRTASLLVLILTAGAYLPSPLYPAYQRLFGFDDLSMTLIFGMFALVSGPALLLCGPASDVVGPRPMLRLSVVVAAASSCCFVFADSTAWLFAGRVGQALALGAATGAAQSLIIRHHSPAARLGGPLLAGLAFTLGTAAGPALSGALAQFAPAPLLTPFLLHLALLGWMWLRLHRTVPAVPAATAARRRWRPTRARIPADLRPLFAVSGTNGFLAWAVLGIYLALVPALLAGSPRTDGPALAGGLLGAVLLCSLAAQMVSARRTPGGAQQAGVALLASSLLLLAATGAVSLAATLVAAVLAGVGHGLAFSGATRAVDARTPPSQRGGIGAALHLLFYLGSGAPAVLVGVLTTWMPLTSAVTRISWAGAAAAALALLAGVRRPPRDRAGGATQPSSSVFVRRHRVRRRVVAASGGPGSRRPGAGPGRRLLAAGRPLDARDPGRAGVAQGAAGDGGNRGLFLPSAPGPSVIGTQATQATQGAPSRTSRSPGSATRGRDSGADRAPRDGGSALLPLRRNRFAFPPTTVRKRRAAAFRSPPGRPGRWSRPGT